jgi:hypothetical protein
MVRKVASAPQLWRASSVENRVIPQEELMRNATIRRALPVRAVTAALVAATAMGGTALAASPYTVKLTVPKNPSAGSTFKVKATGVAANTSQVVAYIGNKACASTPKAEAAQPARRVLNKSVNHTYTASKTANVGSAGNHRVCAYLTSTNGSTVRARTSATYTALSGGY